MRKKSIKLPQAPSFSTCARDLIATPDIFVVL